MQGSLALLFKCCSSVWLFGSDILPYVPSERQQGSFAWKWIFHKRDLIYMSLDSWIYIIKLSSVQIYSESELWLHFCPIFIDCIESLLNVWSLFELSRTLEQAGISWAQGPLGALVSY